MVKLKPELSKKNKYWVDKNRYYELKYFCLQYPLWKRTYDLIKLKEAEEKNIIEIEVESTDDSRK